MKLDDKDIMSIIIIHLFLFRAFVGWLPSTFIDLELLTGGFALFLELLGLGTHIWGCWSRPEIIHVFQSQRWVGRGEVKAQC